jgi:hypothetical protein
MVNFHAGTEKRLAKQCGFGQGHLEKTAPIPGEEARGLREQKKGVKPHQRLVGKKRGERGRGIEFKKRARASKAERG